MPQASKSASLRVERGLRRARRSRGRPRTGSGRRRSARRAPGTRRQRAQRVGRFRGMVFAPALAQERVHLGRIDVEAYSRAASASRSSSRAPPSSTACRNSLRSGPVRCSWRAPQVARNVEQRRDRAKIDDIEITIVTGDRDDEETRGERERTRPAAPRTRCRPAVGAAAGRSGSPAR